MQKIHWVSNSAYTGWRFYCGVTPKGTRKAFYLGSHELQANQKALKIEGQWLEIIASGGKSWGDKVTGTSPEKVGKPEKPEATEPTIQRQAVTLHESQPKFWFHPLISRWLDEQKIKDISDRWRSEVEWRVNRLKTISPNLELSRTGITEIINAIPYKGAYRQNFIVILRRFLTWLEATTEWRVKGWQSLVQVKRFAPKITIPSLEEISSAWKASTERTRLYLLLALNCAMTQTEISSLTPSCIRGEYLEVNRHKTSIEGRYWLWPETRRLLEQFGHKSGKLLLTTTKGYPLVHGGNTGTDSIRLALERVKGCTFSFKQLRKFSAQTVLRLSGSTDLCRWHLQHKCGDVLQVHYVLREWELLFQVHRKMEKEIVPVLMKGGAK